ncbi:FAD-dependent oxidoreductase [soil metagenome]
MEKRTRVAIIGAGVAGLGAAYRLREAPASVVIFEKSRGVGGRVATRSRHVGATRVRFDHGAQYIRPESDSPIFSLLTEELDSTALVAIDRPIWPVDETGKVRPDLTRPATGPQWTYADGISRLGKLLLAASGAELRTQVRVARVEKAGREWHLFDEAGEFLSVFDRVLFTAPAAQTADILAASSSEIVPELVDDLRSIPYRAQFTFTFAFDQLLPRPEAYAFVDTSSENALAWLAFETDKPNRAPSGWTVLVAQMSDAWTREHFDDDPADLAEMVRAMIGELSEINLPYPVMSDHQRWRFALPSGRVDESLLSLGHPQGLHLAGDFTVGEGRVHLALQSGIEEGAIISESISAPVYG